MVTIPQPIAPRHCSETSSRAVSRGTRSTTAPLRLTILRRNCMYATLTAAFRRLVPGLTIEVSSLDAGPSYVRCRDLSSAAAAIWLAHDLQVGRTYGRRRSGFGSLHARLTSSR